MIALFTTGIGTRLITFGHTCRGHLLTSGVMYIGHPDDRAEGCDAR